MLREDGARDENSNGRWLDGGMRCDGMGGTVQDGGCI